MKTKSIAAVGMLAIMLACQDVHAWGLRGGGGGGRSFGGGGGRSFGGGGARPSMGASRPQFQARPSTPNLGASRPASRPQISHPTASRPSVSRPATSNLGSNRPSGGFNPSTPSRPQVINNRPTTLPGNNTRPGSIQRPNTLPGNTTRPGSIQRPNTLPANTRPSLPNLGGSKPNLPNFGGNQPGTSRPNLPNMGNNRPTPGNVGDFLGMDRPLQPSNRPGQGNRFVIDQPGVNRPNIGNNPNIGNRPNIGNNTNIGNRVNAGINNRPVNIGEINVGSGNRVINNRPTWANINNNRLTNINNNWQSQLGGLRNWQTLNPRRTAYWNGWANGVRSHWGNYRNYGWFNNNWWHNHPHALCGWHYGYWFNRYPASYWWSIPTYAALTNWFTWTAPAGVWTQPVYYDYGTGGNVVYQDNSVYINNQPVATAEEFAASAAALATVPPPASEEAASGAEWMPLGTFAVSASQKDVNPNRVIQLAVNKQGIISGTLYNTETDEAQSVQGQVDKQTQRVAFRIGESEDIVVETGLYDLTQAEAPLLVHFGKDKVENYLLVRLEEPTEDGQTPAQ